MQLKIGADPEFFLKGHDHIVSAHDIVPGSKSKPHPLQAGAVQADGTAVEFNIKPATSEDEFVSSIRNVLLEIRNMIPQNLEFHYEPAVIYPKDYFDQLPKFSKELGCDPDYNAYTGERNPPPDGSPENTMRTGAGHIHLGWTEGIDPMNKSHMWDCCNIVKRMDQYFKYFEPLWDKDQMRRAMYGARGAFRPKPYGCEYRVLSNAWLRYPKMWPWLYQITQHIFHSELNDRPYDYGIPYARSRDPVDYANQAARYYIGDKGIPEFKQEFLN